MKLSIFDKTFNHYITLLKEIDLKKAAAYAGCRQDESGKVLIRLFDQTYTVSLAGVFDVQKKRPEFSICVLLFNYLLRSKRPVSTEEGWISFREIPGSAPLADYFAAEVEGAIAGYFSLNTNLLEKRLKGLDHTPPDIDLNVDTAAVVLALPRISLLFTFNDSDETFPAVAKLLFNRTAADHLDPECLAILARLFYLRLAEKPPMSKH